MIVFLNGAFVAEADAMVSIRDRAFLFGDAVYEALRARAGRYFEPDRHMHRLRYGLNQLRITMSDVELARLLPTGEALLRLNDLLLADALLYMQVSRGVAARRHAFPESPCLSDGAPHDDTVERPSAPHGRRRDRRHMRGPPVVPVRYQDREPLGQRRSKPAGRGARRV